MRTVSVFLLAFFTYINMQAQQAFTLEESIDYALVHQPEMRLEQLKVADADKQVKEYLASGLPTLEGKVGYQYFFDIPTQIIPDFLTPVVYNVLIDENLIGDRPVSLGPGLPAQFGTKHVLNAGLEFSTLLFDGSFFVGLKAQRLYKDLIRREGEVKQYEISDRVTRAYLAVLIAEKNLGIVDDNIANLSKLFSDTRATYEEGFAELLDVERLQLSLENLQAERENLQQLIDLSYNLLRFQMGYPVDQDIQLTDDFDRLTGLALVASPEEQGPIDISERPELQVLSLGESLNEMNIRRLRVSYLPSLRGFATYQHSLQRNDLFDGDDNPWFPTTVAGVNLNVPIFDGLDRSAKIQRARISLEKTQVERELFIRGAELEARNARIALENARKTALARKKSLDLAERIYETTQIKYREGVGSSIELSQAETAVFDSQARYIEALYNLVIAQSDLKQALGK